MLMDAKEIIKRFRGGRTQYNEDYHCELLIKVMTDPNKGTMPDFCVEAMISEKAFWNWTQKHEVFSELYSFLKMYSRKCWEDEGRRIKDMVLMRGESSFAFEHWKLIGWSRFGVSKNSRIKLNLDPNDTPEKHYSQLLKQASEGDFTAAEIKQLMEAVNVGLNTHQVFQLQKEIDQLKSDLVTMKENSCAYNTSAN